MCSRARPSNGYMGSQRIYPKNGDRVVFIKVAPMGFTFRNRDAQVTFLRPTESLERIPCGIWRWVRNLKRKTPFHAVFPLFIPPSNPLQDGKKDRHEKGLV